MPLALMIEDNEMNRYLATFLLEKAGFEVVSAVDGPKGIELAREIEPDIILLDIQLPGMDGYQVATELLSQKALAHVPIVAVTSYAMPEDRKRVEEVGCHGYIEKPIDPERFVDQIESYMKSSG